MTEKQRRYRVSGTDVHAFWTENHQRTGEMHTTMSENLHDVELATSEGTGLSKAVPNCS